MQGRVGDGIVADVATAHRQLLNVAQVFDQIPAGFCIVDLECRFVYANDMFLVLSGLSDKAHIGQPISQTMANAGPRIEGLLRQAMAYGTAQRGQANEYDSRIKSGEKVFLQSTFSPIHDDQGKVIGASCLVADVTEQVKTDEALTQSDERLNLSLDAGSIGTWTWNLLEGTHIWDTRMLAMSGMPSDAARDVMEAEFVRTLHPDDVDSVMEAARKSLEDDAEYNVDYRIYRRDNGELRHINARALVVRDDRGQAIRMTGVSIDVTKQKRIEAELRMAQASLEERVLERTQALNKSNRRLQTEMDERGRAEAAGRESEKFVSTVISNMVDALITMDEKGVVSSFNQGAERIFGYPDHAVIGQNIKMLMAEPDRSKHDGYLSKHQETGRSSLLGQGPRQVTGRHQDGRDLFLELAVSSVEMEQGTLYIGALRDISERRRLEELFQRVVENSPNSIILKDLEDRVLLVNRRYEEWTGRAARDVVGKTTRDIYPMEYAERAVASDQEVIRIGQSLTEEWETTFSDGNQHYLIANKFPVTDAGGKVIGVCTISVDVSQLRAAETQLRQAQKMEAIGQLTGGIAHDFNNLLAIMMGNLSLMQETPEQDPEVAELLEPTMRAIDQAASLTARMLAFSRQQPLEVKQVDANELLRGIESLIKRSLVEDIEVSFDLAPDLPLCLADPRQLEQAILNLSINARDAMPQGGAIRIETANVSTARDADRPSEALPGDYVMIAVSDDGVGISDEDQARIFDPFFTTKEVGKGTGLGLSMVYGFVKQSEGHIVVDSAKGTGTTFRIFLSALAEGDEEPPWRPADDQPARTGKREVILVVEDERDVQVMVSMILRRLGYEVLLASTGAEGLKQLARNPNIDLLLTDVLLPGGMNGQQMVDLASADYPALKTLFMSGYARDAFVDQGRLKPGIELLGKPFGPSELAQRIRDALDG